MQHSTQKPPQKWHKTTVESLATPISQSDVQPLAIDVLVAAELIILSDCTEARDERC